MIVMKNKFFNKNKTVIVNDFKSLNHYLITKLEEWDKNLAIELIEKVNLVLNKYELDLVKNRNSFELEKSILIFNLIKKYNNSEIDKPSDEEIDKLVYEKLTNISNFNIRKIKS